MARNTDSMWMLETYSPHRATYYRTREAAHKAMMTIVRRMRRTYSVADLAALPAIMFAIDSPIASWESHPVEFFDQSGNKVKG